MGAVDNEKTVSELLRETAKNGIVVRNNDHGITGLRRALGSKDTMSYEEDLCCALEAVADRIDAEIEKARSFAYVKFLDEVISINDWPERKPDEGIEGYICRCFLPRPLFEDGDPVQFGDDFIIERYMMEPETLRCLRIFTKEQLEEWGQYYGISPVYELNFTRPSCKDGVPIIKRPAPKVLDADGVEIRVGDTVYETHRGEALTVYEVNSQYVHAKTENGAVRGNLTASYLTHQKPVFDADGVRICVGDTVWEVDYENHAWTVTEITTGGNVICDFERGDGTTFHLTPVSPKRFTHKEPDSQERIDEDAELNAPAYCKKYGLTPHEASAGKSTKYKHLFKRQRALMERGA